jgi:hypothetical protein
MILGLLRKRHVVRAPENDRSKEEEKVDLGRVELVLVRLEIGRFLVVIFFLVWSWCGTR